MNNAKFKDGYAEFLSGIASSRSYIWSALSGVSEQLGESLFMNVRDYIDNVANVDTCKVKSLMSMMKMLDIDYLMLDKLQYYPVEIQSLIDIMSITKNYLFNNKVMKKDFIDALVNDNVISSYSATSSDAGEVSNFIETSCSFYDSYLSSVYFNFMNDMVCMPYIDNSY